MQMNPHTLSRMLQYVFVCLFLCSLHTEYQTTPLAKWGHFKWFTQLHRPIWGLRFGFKFRIGSGLLSGVYLGWLFKRLGKTLWVLKSLQSLKWKDMRVCPVCGCVRACVSLSIWMWLCWWWWQWVSVGCGRWEPAGHLARLDWTSQHFHPSFLLFCVFGVRRTRLSLSLQFTGWVAIVRRQCFFISPRVCVCGCDWLQPFFFFT